MAGEHTDEFAKRGLPRPKVLREDGRLYPVPWVVSPDDFTKMVEERQREVVANLLCQICGEGHGPHSSETIVNLLVSEHPPSSQSKGGLIAQAMDDAVMHDRCFQLAIYRCPALRRLREANSLWLVRVPLDCVCLVDQDGEDHLGAYLDHARFVNLADGMHW